MYSFLVFISVLREHLNRTFKRRAKFFKKKKKFSPDINLAHQPKPHCLPSVTVHNYLHSLFIVQSTDSSLFVFAAKREINSLAAYELNYWWDPTVFFFPNNQSLLHLPTVMLSKQKGRKSYERAKLRKTKLTALLFNRQLCSHCMKYQNPHQRFKQRSLLGCFFFNDWHPMLTWKDLHWLV